MPFRYLDEQTLEQVRAAAVDSGYAAPGMLANLAAELPPAWVATAIPADGNALSRLFTFIAKLNSTRVLGSGVVPLRVWLKAAIFTAGDAPEAAVFRRALEISASDGAAGAAPAPAQLTADVAALPRTAGELEVQIGDEDDTLGVAFLHLGASASRSVVRLVVQRHFGGVAQTLAGDKPDVVCGTGWLIAPRLVVTNHHVVNARVPLEPAASAADFALQGAHAEVVFDDFGGPADPSTTRSTACVASDATLDYAVLQLAADAPDRPPLVLRGSPMLKPKERALKERVNVLQHPDGKPMRLGFRNNFVVAATDERISYLTDTAGGASGSPLCDDAWFVAGLHRGWTTLPGAPLQVWGQQIAQENYGTPIDRILDHLAQTAPELAAAITAAQQR